MGRSGAVKTAIGVRSACVPILAAWLTAASLAAAGAEWSGIGQAGAGAGKKTVADGVFTEEQQLRGQKTYMQSCAACHKEDLLGDNAAPALAGAAAFDRWIGSTVDDMFQTIKQSMPQDAPDSLAPRAYADIVSYLLKVNGSPAGSTELPIEREALKQILIARPTK